MAKRSSTTDELLSTLKATEESLSMVKADVNKPRKKGKLAAQGAALYQKALDQTTRTHRVAVDLGGGTIAQVSTELINAGVRWLGNWSGKDSWFGKNADILQGAPHMFIGLAVYLTELLMRPKGKLPSMGRELASEAANVFTHLGFANLARALRIRWADGKVDASTLAKVTAERDAAIAKLAGTAK